MVAVLGLRAGLRVSGGRDARIAAIAAWQRGRIARRQLLEAGLSGGQTAWLVRHDRLFPVHAGVYAVGHPGEVPLGAETAALLAAPIGALLSHRSAAALWGLSSVPYAPGVVDVLVGPAGQIRRRGIYAHRSRFHPAAESRLRSGLPVTSPAQTMLDLAAELPEATMERAVDQAIVERILDLREIELLLARLPTHPGAPRLRAVLGEADAGVADSEAGRRLRELLAQTDLPHPRRQADVGGYRLDCYWPDARLAAETDGYRFHSTRQRFEHDRLRDARLAALGIEVMRVTWRQMEREPLAVVARIAAALARRTATGPR